MTAVGLEHTTFRFAFGSIIRQTTASIRSRRCSIFFHLPTFLVTKIIVFERTGMKIRIFSAHFRSVTLEFLVLFGEKNAEKSTFFRVFSLLLLLLTTTTTTTRTFLIWVLSPKFSFFLSIPRKKTFSQKKSIVSASFDPLHVLSQGAIIV